MTLLIPKDSRREKLCDVLLLSLFETVGSSLREVLDQKDVF